MTERANAFGANILNTAAYIIRLLGILVLFGASEPVLAFSGAATDDAFAALLSMPGAKPANG